MQAASASIVMSGESRVDFELGDARGAAGLVVELDEVRDVCLADVSGAEFWPLFVTEDQCAVSDGSDGVVPAAQRSVRLCRRV